MKNLQLFYEDIYSALYRWSLQKWHGNEYLASFLTASTLTGAQTCNLLLVLILAIAAFGRDRVNEILPSGMYLPLISAVLFANYLLLVRNERYRLISERFEKKRLKERRTLTLIAWCYLLLSFVVPVVVAYLLDGSVAA